MHSFPSINLLAEYWGENADSFFFIVKHKALRCGDFLLQLICNVLGILNKKKGTKKQTGKNVRVHLKLNVGWREFQMSLLMMGEKSAKRVWMMSFGLVGRSECYISSQRKEIQIEKRTTSLDSLEQLRNLKGEIHLSSYRWKMSRLWLAMTLAYCQYIEAKLLDEKCIRKYIDKEINCLGISGKSDLIPQGTHCLKEFHLFRPVLTSAELDLKGKLAFRVQRR